MSPPKIQLIVCPALTGHYPTYLRMLLQNRRQGDPQLVVLGPEGLAELGGLQQLVTRTGAELRVLPAAPWRSGPGASLRQAKLEWSAAAGLARAVGAQRCVFLHIDVIAQTLLALQVPFPCPVAGILYRPSPHYGSFPMTELSLARRLRGILQARCLAAAARNRCTQGLYWLDPYASSWLGGPSAKHFWLPDPVEGHRASEVALQRVRAKLDVGSEDRVWLLFGPSAARKGVLDVLDSLPELSAASARDVVAIVGVVSQSESTRFWSAVRRARAGFRGRVVVVDERVPDADVVAYFGVAHAVLVLYQQHVGSSGVLLRAAEAGRPVVATHFGLVGQWTREHRLGLCTGSDSGQPVLNALEQAFSGGLYESFDPASARRFVARHQPEAFVSHLLDREPVA